MHKLKIFLVLKLSTKGKNTKTVKAAPLKEGVHLSEDKKNLIIVVPYSGDYYSAKMRIARIGTRGGFQPITDNTGLGFQKANISLGRNKTAQEKGMSETELEELL
jgi:hypothetical protein